MDDINRPASAREIRLMLPAELVERLKELSRRKNVPVCVTLLTGWTVLLGRWRGHDEVVVRVSSASAFPGTSSSVAATVVAFQLSEHLTVEELLERIRALVAQERGSETGFESQHFSEGVGPVLQPLTDMAEVRAPAITSSQRMSSKLACTSVLIEEEQSALQLSLSLSQSGREVVGRLQRTDEQGEPEAMLQMAVCWEVVLEEIVKDVQQSVSRLQLLSAPERERVLRTFNDTEAPYSQERLIHELFEVQAHRSPLSIALVQGQQSLTYEELNNRANQLAWYLVGKGIARDQLIGIYAERSFEAIVGLLGILKAGGAYLPLDPTHPSERLACILEDAAPSLLLIQGRLRNRLPPTSAQLVELDNDWHEIANFPIKDPDARSLRLTSRNLAYVIYTSGSTGKPKGVAAEHRGMVNRILAQQAIEAFDDSDICCHKTSIGFVDAIFEILGPLSYGRPLVIAPVELSRDVRDLASLIDRAGVTRLVTVPSLAGALLASAESVRSLQKLRSWTLSGEELTEDLLRTLQERLPRCTVINLYGSSEVAADVTFHVCRTAALGKVPIGRPIQNARIYILDRHLQPVPIGMVGEICVGGPAVARGYLNRPGLTAEKFIADAFGPDPRAHIYRSGDRGRWRADGTIEYLGRNDGQVKIRGFRIELGEIEAALARHPGVKEVAVIAREETPGEKFLVAYIAGDGDAQWGAERLRTHLRSVLPDPAIPRAIVMLERLPRTPSGKVDRHALPSPQPGAYAKREYEAPKSEFERILAGIWQDLLRVEQIGRQDNFFALGGHSLLLVRLMDRLRQVGLSAEAGRLFESQTLADMAGALRIDAAVHPSAPAIRIPAGCTAITPQMLSLIELDEKQIEQIESAVAGGAANIQDIYPLAPLQEGVLFHHLLDERGGETYVATTVLSVSSPKRLRELLAALQCVIDRHDVLRTAVLWERLQQPVQVVYRRAELPVMELSIELGIEPEVQIEQWIMNQRQRLDLRRAPLVQVHVASSTPEGRQFILLQTHHFACDDESLRLLLSEAMAIVNGRAHELPQSVPYRNHIAQALANARPDEAATFFGGKLGDVDESTAPFGLLDVHGDGRQIEQARTALDSAWSHRIRLQASRLGVSPATLFHAACSLVVAGTSGRDDVVFGSVLLGRLQGSAGAQRTIGMFINTLPLRLRLREVTTTELVTQVQRELADLLRYEQSSLAVAQRCSGMVDSAPLFTVLLNYRHGDSGAAADRVNASDVRIILGQDRTNYPITLSIDDAGEGFAVTAQTDRRIDPNRMAAYLVTSMQSIVAALECNSPSPVLSLPILPEHERRQVIELFNAPRAVQLGDRLIHELFEEQVDRTPHAIAIVYEGQTLTYAQLNSRANMLARYLAERGVVPDELVGLYVERSLEMVVGLLGVLKTGGGYLPLDPAYPAERVAYTLKDAAPRILLTQDRLRGRLPSTSVQVVALDGDWDEISRQQTANVDVRASGLRPEHLAYVIYTSGSTGNPKGVMVEHRNVTRLFSATQHWFGFDERDVWTLFHSIAFDFSVWELWGALLHGGRVVVVPQLTARSPQEFYRLLCRERVTVLNQTPSAFTQLIEAQARCPEDEHALRWVIFGGEALELRVLRPWIKRNGANGPTLVNMYGITETTVHVTYRPLCDEEIASERSSVIGRPIPDLYIYLLNRYGHPVPIGVPGEIYVGGAGVARGYLNCEELTAQRFIADPFSSDPQSRLYRSGDVGRWRADGTLEYLGRNDDQVKIRGFRIELGDVEAQLARHQKVKEAVVVAREDVQGEKRLVAYITRRGTEALSVDELRSHLHELLPQYMVPSAFVFLGSLPLTPSGKLNRRALPPPDLAAYAVREYEAPRGETEEMVARVWQETLHVGRVGRQDNFFNLGGHSLLAMQVIGRIHFSLPIEVSVRSLFEAPTLGQFAAYIDGRRAALMSDAFDDDNPDIDTMIDTIAALPESKVDELMRELRAGMRS